MTVGSVCPSSPERLTRAAWAIQSHLCTERGRVRAYVARVVGHRCFAQGFVRWFLGAGFRRRDAALLLVLWARSVVETVQMLQQATYCSECVLVLEPLAARVALRMHLRVPVVFIEGFRWLQAYLAGAAGFCICDVLREGQASTVGPLATRRTATNSVLVGNWARQFEHIGGLTVP